MTDDRGLWFGNKPSEAATTEFANNHAYVIGINAYSNGIPPLRTAVADAERLGRLLEESHGYKTLTYPRDGAPSLANLRNLLREKLPQEVGADDRVLFYFAGHGIALDGEDGPEGYLVPEDANREDRTSFLSMTELNDALAKLPCRHLLLILDCCFAGAFRWSSTRDLSALPSVIHRERYERYIQDPAWQVLTSAAYDQTALDVLSGNTIGERMETAEHSPFAAALFRALAGDADLIPRGKEGQPGGDGVITATELYLYLRECVETVTVEQRIRQTPGLWPLKKHDKGEYILLTPGHELNLPPAPELNYANNPYRGLQSFEEEHSQLFFGRAREIEELRTLVSSQTLTVVLGASGTGKSSVVKAGLLPRLRTIDGEDWQILPTIRPGKSPLATLASLSLPGEAADADEASRLSQLWLDENAFARRIQDWAKAQPGASRLLLTVDQFEEMVTLCWDGWERDRFIELLASALDALPEQFRLIITLRSDFEPQFSNCALKSQWMPSRYIVPAMSTDDLREAIEGPASICVLYFQPAELVDRLIDEVIQTPGAMPLLSFTLSELYVRYLERRGDDRCLTLADYEQLGGVAGSLRSRATELYNKLDGPHQATMQRIMLRMVSAQGGELARRRVPKSELAYPSDDENERVSIILNRLSEARLVVEGKEVDGDPYVEPAHDELVRGWDKLLEWTRREQEQLMLRRLLTPAANDWQSHQGGTWHTNPRLSLLKRIQKSEDSWLNRTEASFVIRSVGKRRRILFGVVSFVAIAFLALSISTIYAFQQRDEARTASKKADERRKDAERQTRVAIGERLAAQSIMTRSEKPQLSVLLAAAGVDVTQRVGEPHSLAAQQALLDGLGVCGGLPLPGHNDGVESLAISSDSKWLVTTGARTAARIWNLKVTDPVSSSILVRGSGERLLSPMFSPDNRWLVLGSADPESGFDIKMIYLYDLDSASPADTGLALDGHSKKITSVSISSDSHWLITSSWDTTTRLWNLTSNDPAASPIVLNGHTSSVLASAVSRDSRWLVTGSDNESAIVWDLKSEPPGVKHSVLEGQEGGVSQILFSPDNTWLITDGHPQLWDVKGSEGIGAGRTLPEHGIGGMTISNDSRWFVTTGTDGNVYLSDLTAPNPPGSTVTLKGHSGNVHRAEFSNDSKWLVTAARGTLGGGMYDPFTTPVPDNTARLWNLLSADPSTSPLILEHDDTVTTVTFTSDNQWLLTACADHNVRRWRLSPEKLGKAETEGQKTPIQAFIDAGFDAAALKGMRVSGYDLISLGFEKDKMTAIGFTPEELLQPKPTLKDIVASAKMARGHEGPVHSMVASPDSRWLVTANSVESPRLWDLNQIEFSVAPLVLSDRATSSDLLMCSPDGHWLFASGIGVLYLFDMSAPDPIRSRIVLPNHGQKATAAAFDLYSRWLAVGNEEFSLNETSSVLLWDLNEIDNGQKPILLPSVVYPASDESRTTYTAPVQKIAFTPDGRWLCVHSWGINGFADVRLWDLTARDPASTSVTLDGNTNDIRGFSISRDGHWIVTTSSDSAKVARLWNLSSQNPAQSPIVLGADRTTVHQAEFSFDCKRLITSGWNISSNPSITTCVWDLSDVTSETIPKVLPGTFSSSDVFALSCDDHWLLTLSHGKLIRLWNLMQKDITANPIVLLDGHTETIFEIQISPDSRWLATEAAENTAFLWDLKSASPEATRKTLRGHTRRLRGIEFSPDSRWLITVGTDDTARLWNLTASDPTSSSVVLQHVGIDKIAISSKSEWLVSSGTSRTLYIWPLGISNLVDIGRRTAGRNFTDEERHLFDVNTLR